jgi:CheY-like chemotaxis protein
MNGLKILIIEDEDVIAMDLQDRFKYWGYSTPVIASSREEVLKIASEIKPDLVLIDIKLKNDNGIEIAKNITNNFDTAIIYITSYLNAEMIQLMRATKPYGYVSIPFEENQLKYNVEEALYRRRIYRRFILSK